MTGHYVPIIIILETIALLYTATRYCRGLSAILTFSMHICFKVPHHILLEHLTEVHTFEHYKIPTTKATAIDKH